MQLFSTPPNAKAAYNAIKVLEVEYRLKYIANSSESDRNSKHFDCGYDGWYDTDEHHTILAQCGFNSIDEYQTAFEATDWNKCYDKFRHILDITKGEDHKALIAELKASGLWNEDNGIEQGIQLYECCKKAAPKHTQLADLVEELGLKWPVMARGWN